MCQGHAQQTSGGNSWGHGGGQASLCQFYDSIPKEEHSGVLSDQVKADRKQERLVRDSLC